MPGALPLFPDLDPSQNGRRPEGLHHADDVVSPADQQALVERFGALAFAPFEFRGFQGARRTVAFGSRYDFTQNRVREAAPLPDWLVPVRALAADFAGLAGTRLVHALVTEYAPGAGIGWHRDRPEYDKVVGLSFGSACDLRFRRRDGETWRRAALHLRPGSAYLLDGEARDAWQHSIVPGDRLRYSVTFRSMRG